MKKFAAGVVLTLVCIIGGVYAHFAGGFAPAAAALLFITHTTRLWGGERPVAR